MRDYETLMNSEVKSRIYLALLDNWKNKSYLANDAGNGKMQGEYKVGYSRGYLDRIIDEMARKDKTLIKDSVDSRETEKINLDQERSSVSIYKSDLNVYIDFLQDMGEKKKEIDWNEIKEIILGYSPAYNKIGCASMKDLDVYALMDIPFYIIAPKFSSENTLRKAKRNIKESTNFFFGNTFFKNFKLGLLAFKKRYKMYPEAEIEEKVTEKSEKYYEFFFYAFALFVNFMWQSNIGKEDIRELMFEFSKIAGADMDELDSFLKSYQ